MSRAARSTAPPLAHMAHPDSDGPDPPSPSVNGPEQMGKEGLQSSDFETVPCRVHP